MISINTLKGNNDSVQFEKDGSMLKNVIGCKINENEVQEDSILNLPEVSNLSFEDSRIEGQY